MDKTILLTTNFSRNDFKAICHKDGLFGKQDALFIFSRHMKLMETLDGFAYR